MEIKDQLGPKREEKRGPTCKRVSTRPEEK